MSYSVNRLKNRAPNMYWNCFRVNNVQVLEALLHFILFCSVISKELLPLERVVASAWFPLVGWDRSVQFSSFQLLSCVQLFATPWITACQASLSITISQSSLKLTSIKSMKPSSHLILCHPLLLLPRVPPRIRVFSNESTLCMRWPKYWSFSFSIIPSKEHPGKL